MKFTSILLALLFSFAPAFAFKSANYKVNPAKSTIKWTGEKVSGEHFGTLKIKEGLLEIADQTIVQGTFAMDMTTITVDDIEGEWADKLLGHLKSDDFFSVAKHNASNFEIINVKDLGNNKAKISGRLTIKGITKVISFDTEYKIVNGEFVANASISIDRTKYDIKYGSGNFFDGLGDKMIYDDFVIDLKLVANKLPNSVN